MYNYITIISLIFVSLSHAQYLIGTGRGLLAVVGDTMKEVKWDPNSFGSASQLWDFELDPRFPNGSFFVGAGKKVWDIAGTFPFLCSSFPPFLLSLHFSFQFFIIVIIATFSSFFVAFTYLDLLY
jgi:hypothetical protein